MKQLIARGGSGHGQVVVDVELLLGAFVVYYIILYVLFLIYYIQCWGGSGHGQIVVDVKLL